MVTRELLVLAVVYVERRGKKLVGVILGERSTARLYKRMAKIVDEGFAHLNGTSFE